MSADGGSMQFDFDELVVDSFAGGGGASTGIRMALGRCPDVAVNHDGEALAMHEANHPKTQHIREDVWAVDPERAMGWRQVGLLWASPDCKHFSKAKGGKPVSKKIRGLAWVITKWAAKVKPRVIIMENVEEFRTWGPLMKIGGEWYPDPSRQGQTYERFLGRLRKLGYVVEARELRACDYRTPTIRKRLVLIARRDKLPIVWPEPTHGDPKKLPAMSGKVLPWRTAAECIDFSIQARSIFDRDRALAKNTLRRVAKGTWRHVLTSAKPFIVGAGGRMSQSPERGIDQPAQTITAKADACIATPVLAPFVAEHANASNDRTMPAGEPLRTICAQVKGGHFSVVSPELAPFIMTNTTGHAGAPIDAALPTVTTGGHHALTAATIAPLRGTSESHLSARAADEPLSAISAGGTHHGLISANLITIGYGERKGQDARTHSLQVPLGTVVAGGIKHGLAAVHLTHLTHHGERSGSPAGDPLPTITGAHRGEQALVSACLEQANGGFYEGDGHSALEPVSTITAAGSNQRLVTAYCVKYYSSGGQWQGLDDPMHTLPTKGRMGLVQVVKVPVDCIAPEHRRRARLCAELLREHLPEHFNEPAELVLMWHDGAWWVLVDITLRMLTPRELATAQGFPLDYIIDRGLFVNEDGTREWRQLTKTAQVRMIGNSVCPPLAEALVRANFTHEQRMRKAA